MYIYIYSHYRDLYRKYGSNKNIVLGFPGLKKKKLRPGQARPAPAARELAAGKIFATAKPLF